MQQRSLQQVRVSVSLIFLINLSDPRTDHRNLGFEDSCLSGAPPSFSRHFGQVVDDGGNRFRSRHACCRMAH